MADLKSVGVRLYALNADYKKSMKESGDATQSFGKVSGVALAAVGTAAAGMALKAADGYVAYGKTIMGLSRISGESVETMSKLNFAAQQTGVSAETLSAGIKFLQKNMASGNEEFAKLNVTTKNADGTYRNVHDVFLDTADAISKMSNATEKADAIREIFGRNGQALGALLNKGRDGIIALEGAAQKYGLVLTQDNIPAIQANIKAHREMDAAMQGAQNQIGQNVLPMLTSAITLFSNLPGPIASSIAPLAGVTGGVVLLSKATSVLGLSLGPIGALIALVGGGGALIKGSMDSGKKSLDELSASVIRTVSGAQTMNDLNRIFGKTQEQIKSLDEEVKGLHNPFDVGYEHELRSGITLLQTSAIVQAVLKEQVLQYAKANGVSEDVALRAVQAQQAHARAVAENGAAAKVTAEEIAAMTDATKAENDAITAALNPQFAMMDATKKLGEAKQKNAEAEWAVVAANNAYNQAVLLYGPNSAAATDALWKLNDAKAAQTQTTSDLARANMDLDVAVNNLELSFKSGQSSFEDNKRILQEWVSQGRMTQAQADSVTYRMWLMKSAADAANGTQVVLTVEAQGLHDALKGFADLSQFTGASINKGWGAFGLGGIGVLIGNAKNAKPNAAGTTGMADGWNTVGEAGPELMYKRGSAVSVFSNPQSNRMLASASTGGGGGGVTNVSHNTYNVTVQAPFGVDVSEVTRNISRSLANLENSTRRR